MHRYDVDGLDNRDPVTVARFARAVDEVVRPYFRAEVRGLERLPAGAALYVSNHNGGLVTPDSFLFASAAYRAGGIDAVPYMLAADTAIRAPLVHQLVVPLGAVRASPENAHALFARGSKVLVYPGGELDAMRTFRQRDRIVFGGRRGYIRLALREGVPIVPVVAAGAHSGLVVLDSGRWLAHALHADDLLRIKAWPIALCVPWGVVVGPGLLYFPWPTRILIEALDPVVFDRTGEAAANDEAYVRACAEAVESRMQEALTRLSRERRAGRAGAWYRASGAAEYV